MTEEIKGILYKLRSDEYYEEHYQQSVYYEKDLNKLENYITNLQKENEDLKDNQVRALNKIKDYINASKCETLEGNYSNDEHSQYWILFNKQLKEIQKLIKGVNINQYVNIPKYREKELLNKEEKLGDYKQRNEKAIEYIKNNDLFTETYDYDEEDNLIWNGATDEKESEELLNILEGGDE